MFPVMTGIAVARARAYIASLNQVLSRRVVGRARHP